MTEPEIRALFTLARIEIKSLYELPNGYWPDVADYADVRRQSPWWLVITTRGPIRIGWRKRVIDIDWSNTNVRLVVTEDDTTKSETNVHAWSIVKALEYLIKLRSEMNMTVRDAEKIEDVEK